MNLPGESHLIIPQMEDRIVGAACLVALASGYENAYEDCNASALFDFHKAITQELIYELGYCLQDRFGEGDGA